MARLAEEYGCSTVELAIEQGLLWLEPILALKRENLLVHHSSRIDGFLKLECGEGMVIGPDVHLASFSGLGIGGGLLLIEKGAAVAQGCRIVTGSNVPGIGRSCSATFGENALIERSFVRIGKNAVVFCNSVVLPGCDIGENAVIGAGSVVRHSVPAGEKWAGNPARRIGYVGGRDNGNESDTREMRVLSSGDSFPQAYVDFQDGVES